MAWRVPAPELSYICVRDAHASCPHKYGSGGSLLRRKPSSTVVLCGCPCHDGCPVRGVDKMRTGRPVASEELWRSACTCPAAAGWRDREASTRVHIEERQRRAKAAWVDADLQRGDTAETIKRKVTAAFAAHDLPMETDFSRQARFLSAGLGRTGTRRVRFLLELIRGLRAARRLGPPEPPDSDNARSFRRLRRTAAAIAAAGIVAVVAARFTSGRLRPVLVTVGGFLTAVGGALTFLEYALSSLFRGVEGWVSKLSENE